MKKNWFVPHTEYILLTECAMAYLPIRRWRRSWLLGICSQILAVVNKAAINICVLAFSWTRVFSFFIQIPTDMTAIRSKERLGFVRNYQTVFQSVLPLCMFTSNKRETQLLHILVRVGGVGVLGFDHFNRFTRAISLLFGPQPSDAVWCCALFHTLND